MSNIKIESMQDLGGNTGRNPFGENIPAKYKLIKEKQRTFNLDNGLRFVVRDVRLYFFFGYQNIFVQPRVHERGKTDAFFSSFTLLIVALGGVEWCRVVFKMAYPNGLK